MNITDYRAYNNSCRKTLIFNLGSNAGFFSEYNNMLKAIAYCLMHKIKFVLYSANAHFAYQNGWEDYFLPFTDEVRDEFHRKFNRRFPARSQTRSLRLFVKYNIGKVLNRKKNEPFIMFAGFIKQSKEIRQLKRIHAFHYFTYDLWDDFHRLRFDENVEIDGLFQGTVGELIDVIDEMIWVFNERTLSDISNMVDPLNMPDYYVGLHIRGGDKSAEAKILGHEQYFDLLQKTDPGKNRDVFISSDDYRSYQLTLENYPGYNIYSLCQPEDRGFFYGSYINQEKDVIREHILVLLASVELLKKSRICIGTYSSNVGRYLKMKLPENAFYSLD